MSVGWAAAGTRGRGLLRRQVGADGARRLAASSSLAEAVGALARTAYGHDVRPGMDLAAAQHAVAATLLWHLRVLAGWGPPLGAIQLRVLAGRFEIANVTERLVDLLDRRPAVTPGTPPVPPYALGALATAWPRVEQARTPEGVRQVLAGSPWGDPGGTDPAAVRLALELSWARRVTEAVPHAADPAIAYAALVIARTLSAGASGGLNPTAVHDGRRLLGSACMSAPSLGALVGSLPHHAARLFEDVTDPDDLWRAEARWWVTLEAGGRSLAASSPPGVGSTIGAAELLATDAWRVRAALEVAARNGRPQAEVTGVLA